MTVKEAFEAFKNNRLKQF